MHSSFPSISYPYQLYCHKIHTAFHLILNEALSNGIYTLPGYARPFHITLPPCKCCSTMHDSCIIEKGHVTWFQRCVNIPFWWVALALEATGSFGTVVCCYLAATRNYSKDWSHYFPSMCVGVLAASLGSIYGGSSGSLYLLHRSPHWAAKSIF